MHYSRQNCPASFKFLKPEVKDKAIEIANLLLESGFERDTVDVIALSNAKLWACYSNCKPEGLKKNVHLVPHPTGWALISEDAFLLYFILSSKSEALVKARAYAKNEKLRLYIHSLAGNINDSESFVVNRPATIAHKPSEEPTMLIIRPHAAANSSVILENKREAIKKARWVGTQTHLNPVPSHG